MMRKQPVWRASTLGALTMFALCGFVATQKHVSDDLNNNSIASFWDHGSGGNMTSAETNGRWEFHNTGPTGSGATSGFDYNRNGINWKKNFHLEFTYKFKVNNVTAPRYLYLGTALTVTGDFPTSNTGLVCGLARDGNGMYVGIATYVNGNITDYTGAPVTQTTGKIEIDWDKATDRITVQRTGGPSVHVDGYYAANGVTYGTMPMRMDFGLITYNGNVNILGSNVFMDNIEMDYYSRAFP